MLIAAGRRTRATRRPSAAPAIVPPAAGKARTPNATELKTVPASTTANTATTAAPPTAKTTSGAAGPRCSQRLPAKSPGR